ncbi:exodeoxyribonuclease V subunit alpha [Nocardioides mesophilus]|uniref:RecBCD enzyme subunit RecD n=1 Tax=Nocardioides mesophilus TaxID=433659 RepID=A0A7G9R9S3_9ACTN|nr:exodeoxyribonuclease V subunit alpha [Nocardioides mesophilus]QNN52348.1 exodeoxyribonuclease V subunit alpha [Nocardioides mesophilus]
MTELFEVTDPADRRLALGATGLLRTFNEAGVLTAADVHVARRVGELAGESDDRVLLAAALATRAVRHGSVCVQLAEVAEVAPGLPWPEPVGWQDAVAASPLREAGVLRLEFGLLYLDRYWHQEVQLCADLQARMARPAPAVDEPVLEAGLLRVFPGPTYGEQRAASRQAATRWTTVLTGGPGTGKTTTVAGLLALLAEQAAGTGGSALRIALTAPTGKAAARLQEAVAAATAGLPAADRQRLGELPALTLHRLLGTRRDNGTRFRHHRGNRLPHDVIVVDESSMVSLTMMTRLVEAVRPDARLVLVGDPDQLASVEAGAVLADLVFGLSGRADSPVAQLATTHRFGEEIGRLAAALRSGSADEVLAVLRAGADEVVFVESDDAAPRLRADIVHAALEVRGHAEAGRAEEAVAALGRHRLLCAHRDGPFGVQHWNRQVEHWLTEATGDPLYEPMYVGRPLLVTANDYGLGVYNGDAGVVVQGDDGPRAVIAGSHGLATFATSRMSDVETMFATTIHKSQGSQAEEVTVLLPAPESRLLTRELFYTAVTRAVAKVRVVGTEESVRAAVERRALRASGLRQRLG